MQVGALNWFNIPAGCPRPKDNEPITPRYVEGWLAREGSTESVFKKFSNGTYLSIATAALGLIGSVFGIKKENPLLKWGGVLLAGIGAGAICVVELFSSLHKWIMLDPVKIEKEELIAKSTKYKNTEMVDINGVPQNTLVGCHFRADKDTNKTILYLHGRANHTADCLEVCDVMREHSKANVLVADYRGFGASEGKASQDALIKDARRMYDYLINEKKVKPEDIVICGHSLGGAVAIQLVKQLQDEEIKVPKLVLQSTFTIPDEVAKEWVKGKVYPWISKALVHTGFIDSLVDGNKFNSVKTIAEICKHTDIHIFHGDSDEIISSDQAESLRGACKSNVHCELVTGCNHSNIHEFISRSQALKYALTPE